MTATPSTTPDDPYELSATGKAFVAGVLRHAREITAVTNQWVNSYKRLIVGGEAPHGGVVGATRTAPRWSGYRCTRRASRRRAG